MPLGIRRGLQDISATVLEHLGVDARLGGTSFGVSADAASGLAALETTMHEHVHLENNVLFPRALFE